VAKCHAATPAAGEEEPVDGQVVQRPAARGRRRPLEPVNAYHVLDQAQPYAEPGGDHLLKQGSANAHAKRLVRELEQLGHKVTLEPAHAA
jgi:hypothetical protein